MGKRWSAVYAGPVDLASLEPAYVARPLGGMPDTLMATRVALSLARPSRPMVAVVEERFLEAIVRGIIMPGLLFPYVVRR